MGESPRDISLGRFLARIERAWKGRGRLSSGSAGFRWIPWRFGAYISAVYLIRNKNGPGERMLRHSGERGD